MLVFVEIGSWSNVQMSWGRGAVPGMVLSSNIPQAKKTWCQACRYHVYTVAYTIVQPQTPTGWMRMQQFLSPFCCFQALGLQGALDIYLTDSTYSTYACVKAGYLHGVQVGPKSCNWCFALMGSNPEASIGAVKQEALKQVGNELQQISYSRLRYHAGHGDGLPRQDVLDNLHWVCEL